MVQAFEFEAFGEEHVEVGLGPVGRRQVLQEHNWVLILHGFNPGREVEEESRTYVAVELGEAFLLGEVGVPNSDDLENVKLSR